ncbi:DUF2167 domain-containing protein [Flexithrix dorotheae]|uniref:DUF2167 domain-containing protein n=1 Tax=Flexithrix dorotheae TaxID=70993 RepID=UPI00037FDDA1|nr:DUF2167 domain-containing protein [Flexithrix dorotheae]
MQTKFKGLFSLLFLIGILTNSFAQNSTEEEVVELDSSAILQIMYDHYVDSIEQTFTFHRGKVTLSNGLAELNVPSGFKYLGPEESEIVLSNIWGNPPREELGLGMLFPEGIKVAAPGIWAIEISYEESGYVEDDEAEDIDYDELLETMQDDTNESNKLRMEMGYESIQLVGWAVTPYYDEANKKLHWAKEIKFGEAEENTLNYNIRILGRKGVLVLNAIADMNQLQLVQEQIDPVLASVEFMPGNTYGEFNPEVDKIAAYGIGGLVAGKVLAKTGFFVVLAKFWKFIAIGFVAAFGFIKKIFFGSKE